MNVLPALGSLTAALLLCAAPVTADELLIYPKSGQDQAQQNKDKAECMVWATNETGFDPLNPPPPPTAAAAPQRNGTAVRGAARGAAAGAAIGAAAGDAGEGAGIGAGVGAARGIRRERREVVAVAEGNQSAMEAYQKDLAAKQGTYRKAMTACLDGRGYSVQ